MIFNLIYKHCVVYISMPEKEFECLKILNILKLPQQMWSSETVSKIELKKQKTKNKKTMKSSFQLKYRTKWTYCCEATSAHRSHWSLSVHHWSSTLVLKKPWSWIHECYSSSKDTEEYKTKPKTVIKYNLTESTENVVDLSFPHYVLIKQ